MKTRTVLLPLLCASLAAAATASEVYQETDENGQVIYSDRPAAANARKLKLRSRATDPRRIEEEEKRRLEREEARARVRAEAADETERKRDLAQQRAANCDKARANQQRLQTSRRLYEVDADGNRKYYSAEEHDAALEKARAQVAEWCDN